MRLPERRLWRAPLSFIAAAFVAVLPLHRVSGATNLGLLPNGEPTCKAGIWTEFPEDELISARVTPDVQCWRDPPCIRTTYLTPEKCARWPNDEDWPTWDPHTPLRPGAKRAGDVLRDFLNGKTIMFVGDSINNLVYNAFTCDLAREGYMPTDLKNVGDDLLLRAHAYNGVAWRGGTNWVGGPPLTPLVFDKGNALVSRKGWHHYGEDDMASLLAMADILVVNYALHYTDNDKHYVHYEAEMRKMFQQASEFAKTPGKAFIFRETGAEHKHEYNDEEEKQLPAEEQYLGCRCQHHPNKDRGIRARNQIIEKLRREFPAVQLAPFYNLTVPAKDMHEGVWCTWSVVQAERDNPRPPNEKEPFCCDCTHFCYTPQMWGNFFDGLWHALEKAPGMLPPTSKPGVVGR